MHSEPRKRQRYQESGRYGALRTLSAVYRILAYVFAAGGGIGVLVGLVAMTDEPAAGFGLIVLSVLYGGLMFVSFLAFAQMIILMIDIENNTRQTAAALTGTPGS